MNPKVPKSDKENQLLNSKPKIYHNILEMLKNTNRAHIRPIVYLIGKNQTFGFFACHEVEDSDDVE